MVMSDCITLSYYSAHKHIFYPELDQEICFDALDKKVHNTNIIVSCTLILLSIAQTI